jgi:hypothetical protein
LGRLCADVLQTVFEEWTRHLRLCSENGGEYVEWTLQNDIFTFAITWTGDESPGECPTPCMNVWNIETGYQFL